MIWNSLIHTFTENYNIYLLITNAVSVIVLLRSLRRNHVNRGLFFVLFFFVARLYLQYNFILLRQSISIVIVWFAIPLILQNKRLKYSLYVLLAATFHFSAIVALVFPFLLNIRINNRTAICVIIGLIIANQVGILNELIYMVANKVFPLVNERLLQYLGMPKGVNLLTFMEAIPFIYIASKYKKELLETREGTLFYNMFYLFLMLLALTCDFSFLTRLWQYMFISYMYLLSFYFKKTATDKNKRMLLSALAAYLLVYSYRYIMMWFYHTPYSFFLFNKF